MLTGFWGAAANGGFQEAALLRARRLNQRCQEEEQVNEKTYQNVNDLYKRVAYGDCDSARPLWIGVTA
jgi:hypothetical protein